MKVTRSYNFVFSREEVNAIHRMWEFMSDFVFTPLEMAQMSIDRNCLSDSSFTS